MKTFQTTHKSMINVVTILDLAKHFVIQFHFKNTTWNSNLKLVYFDTDVFMCAIKNYDVYRDLAKKADFDFSNYEDYFLFDKTNRKFSTNFELQKQDW